MKKRWSILYFLMVALFITYIITGFYYFWAFGVLIYSWLWINTKKSVEEAKKVSYLKYFFIAVSVLIIIRILFFLIISNADIVKLDLVNFLFILIAIIIYYKKVKSILIYNKAFKYYKKNKFEKTYIYLSEFHKYKS